jgi:hypothetical protein
VYPKLAEKCRKEIMELKEKKKRFDMSFHDQKYKIRSNDEKGSPR